MQNCKSLAALTAVVALVSACSDSAPPPPVADDESDLQAPDVSVPKYSAEVFFETTSYGLVGSSAHAFSADDKSLLMSSDDTGVFNAYALPIDGGAPVQLTNSDDNAVFAISWFPEDDRILYTYDGGGNELNHVVVREIDGTN
ncbi:MAG: TolB family protein, partial [Woeseiaceae bacterium]